MNKPETISTTPSTRFRAINGDGDPMNHKRLLALSLGALGVVFGDIGTSPLYVLSSAFSGNYGLAMTPENVLGVVSLVLWTLIIIVCIKYQLFVMRADNKGEGGILALLALLDPWRLRRSKRSRLLIALGVFGAALLYGDGMITPAISVLSAVEGLKIDAPGLAPALNALAPKLTTAVSQQLQLEVVNGKSVTQAATDWLKSVGLL